MKIVVFWDVTPHGSCKNRHVSEERIASIIRVRGIGELGATFAVNSVLQLLVTVPNVVPGSLILFTPLEGGDTFLRKVGSYKGHTA
jgi:hypothetical protein